MVESRESSGLLSLVALRQHETERSQRQAEEARAQAEAEQRARLAAERERAREVEQRAASERDRQHFAEAARRVELSDLERARSAESERAEREARARRDLEMQLIEERNARRQAEILLLGRVSRARSVNLLTAALCLVTWLGVTGVYLGVLRPEADRSRSELERALAAGAASRERCAGFRLRVRISGKRSWPNGCLHSKKPCATLTLGPSICPRASPENMAASPRRPPPRMTSPHTARAKTTVIL